MTIGRPPIYNDEIAAQAEKLTKLGATTKDLADFFEVSTRTIERWSVDHPAFCRSLKIGKGESDDRVERSLYHRANGYSFESVKIFQYEGNPVTVQYTEHVPPDPTSCIFWLKNRRPEEWRDKVDVAANVQGNLTIVTGVPERDES